MPRSAGPCHNFESLFTYGQVQEMGNDLQVANSQEELKLGWEKIKAAANHWEELMAACKTAMSDLIKACNAGSKGKKSGGAGKKAKAAPKSGAGKKAASMYRIFDLKGGQMIVRYDGPNVPETHDMNFPFIMDKKGVPELLRNLVEGTQSGENQALLKEIAEFKALFAKSDLRYTAGKAQSPFSADVGKLVQTGVESIIENHTFLVPFRVIEKHRSIQFEVGAFGTIRFALTGQRCLPLPL